MITSDVISETYEDTATGTQQIRRFQDPTQVWRRPSKKRLRVSKNDLYCQKLELLTYIAVADSMGLHSLVFT